MSMPAGFSHEVLGFILIAIILCIAALPGTAVSRDVKRITIGELDHELIRKLVVYWGTVENGAPQVALREELVERHDRPDGVDEAQIFNAKRALVVVLSYGELAPGTYDMLNRLPDQYLSQSPWFEKKLLPTDGKYYKVEVTAEHLKLLRALSVRAPDKKNPPGYVDEKRPFGTASYYHYDMADILDIEPLGAADPDFPGEKLLSEQQLESLERKYFELQPVLQVFLENAELPLGEFAEDEYFNWDRVAQPAETSVK